MTSQDERLQKLRIILHELALHLVVVSAILGISTLAALGIEALEMGLTTTSHAEISWLGETLSWTPRIILWGAGLTALFSFANQMLRLFGPAKKSRGEKEREP